jgi:hypothetical protein
MDTEASAGMSLVPLDGFPSLAAFIASDPDHTSLVFRRFDRLAARNLLYLQFDAQDQGLGMGNFHAKECAMNWESFRDASKANNDQQIERMKLVIDIREKLKEYSKNIIARCLEWLGHS